MALPKTVLMNSEAASRLTAANDNAGVASAWQTPAECLQMIRRMKEDTHREMLADFRLRADPKHRQLWDIIVELEKCAIFQFYKRRSD